MLKRASVGSVDVGAILCCNVDLCSCLPLCLSCVASLTCLHRAWEGNTCSWSECDVEITKKRCHCAITQENWGKEENNAMVDRKK